METNKNKSVILTDKERKNQNPRSKSEKYMAKLNLQDKKFVQMMRWLDNPEIYREWCEVGHEITMLCQMLDLAMQDFERLGGSYFADLQLHKNAVRAMDKMCDHELAEWTKQGDVRGDQWVSMIGAAQALRERFSVIMNYSFGDKAEWRLNEFNKCLDRSYPDSLREDETTSRRAELIGILESWGTNEKDALEAMEMLKKNDII